VQRLFTQFGNAHRLMGILDSSTATAQLCRCQGFKQLTAKRVKASWDEKRGVHCTAIQFLVQILNVFVTASAYWAGPHMLLMFAGLLRDALAADAASLSAPVVEEAPPAEAAEPVQWDPSTRCYAPDMYRAETVSHSYSVARPIC
jgi:hypothetical protein